MHCDVIRIQSPYFDLASPRAHFFTVKHLTYKRVPRYTHNEAEKSCE